MLILTNLEIMTGVVSVTIVFFLTYILSMKWIEVTQRAGLTGKDMNKIRKKDVSEAGGVPVFMSLTIGLLLMIFTKIFITYTGTHLIEILSILVTILLACFIGFTDDILGWKIGIGQRRKVLLTLPIAIPLMVINAGDPFMIIPFLGSLNPGIFYALLIVPIGVIGATNGFNMLGGLNGLEAGMGTVIMITLGIVGFITSQYWIVFICAATVVALIVFLFSNWYPARLFPGDSLTYPLGALMAAICILGNMIWVGVILFIPYFLELILKARSGFKAECFGEPVKVQTGSVILFKPYKKSYSVTHLFMPNNTESGIVVCLIAIEAWLGMMAVLLVNIGVF